MALTDNLEAYWSLDEASGDAIDAHASFDLTETGGTIAATTGKLNGGRDFEAADTEYFIDGSGTLAQFGDEDFTIALWFKPESFDTKHTLVATGVGSNYGFDLTSDFGDFIRFKVGDGSSTASRTSSNGLSAGTWYFIMAWHDSVNNEIGVRLNAVENTTAYSNGVNSTLADEMTIGGSVLGQDCDGVIDEVSIWSRMLTSDERNQLYNSGNGLAYPLAVGGAKPYRRRSTRFWRRVA